MVSSSPDWNSVACEPFWRQIFEDEFQFENFLNGCKKNRIEKSNLVWNFWQLYKANSFEPILFENQGSVQDKIDNNLEDEIKKLEKIKQIEKDLSKIPDNIDSISEEIKKQNKNSLLQYKKDLDNIKLQILLKNQIKKSITNKLKTYE